MVISTKMSDRSEERKVASDENPSSTAPDSKTVSGSTSPVSSEDTQPDEGGDSSPENSALGQLQHGARVGNSQSIDSEKVGPAIKAEGSKQTATHASDQDRLARATRTQEEVPVEFAVSYNGLEGTLRSRAQSVADEGRSAAAKPSVPSSRPPRVITTTTTAVAPSSSSSTSQQPHTSNSRKPGGALRRGKWTVEEEAYVARVIQDFNSGYLDAPAGTTLRTYLSEKLQCDPMRITKKFTGEACIGKTCQQLRGSELVQSRDVLAQCAGKHVASRSGRSQERCCIPTVERECHCPSKS